MFHSPFRSPFGRTTMREKYEGSSVSATEISNQSKVIKIGRGYKESLVTTSTTFTNIKIPVYRMEVMVTVYQNILGMKHSRAPPSNVITLFKVEGVGKKYGVSNATQSKVSVLPNFNSKVTFSSKLNSIIGISLGNPFGEKLTRDYSQTNIGVGIDKPFGTKSNSGHSQTSIRITNSTPEVTRFSNGYSQSSIRIINTTSVFGKLTSGKSTPMVLVDPMAPSTSKLVIGKLQSLVGISLTTPFGQKLTWDYSEALVGIKVIPPTGTRLIGGYIQSSIGIGVIPTFGKKLSVGYNQSIVDITSFGYSGKATSGSSNSSVLVNILAPIGKMLVGGNSETIVGVSLVSPIGVKLYNDYSQSLIGVTTQSFTEKLTNGNSVSQIAVFMESFTEKYLDGYSESLVLVQDNFGGIKNQLGNFTSHVNILVNYNYSKLSSNLLTNAVSVVPSYNHYKLSLGNTFKGKVMVIPSFQNEFFIGGLIVSKINIDGFGSSTKYLSGAEQATISADGKSSIRTIRGHINMHSTLFVDSSWVGNALRLGDLNSSVRVLAEYYNSFSKFGELNSSVLVVPEFELVRLNYGKYFTIVDLSTIGYGYRRIAFDTIVVHMSVLDRTPLLSITERLHSTLTVMERKVSLEVKVLSLVGNTVRLKAEFTDFNGELLDVIDVTLTVYEGKNKVLAEVTPERLSEGVYFYDYIVPEFSGGSLYFEFKGMLNDKPILGREPLERSWVDAKY